MDFSSDSDDNDGSTAVDAVPATPARSSSSQDQLVPPTPQQEEEAEVMASPPLTPLSNLHVVGNDTLEEEEDDEQIPQDEEEDDEIVVRGTNVNVPTAAATFEAFLREFRSLEASARANSRNTTTGTTNDDDDDDSSLEEDDNDETPPFYLSKIQQLQSTLEPKKSLPIDTMHLYYHNSACQLLYHQLVAYPMELIPLFDLVLQRRFDLTAQVRPHSLKTLSDMRCLDPTQLDSLVGIKGMMVRSSPTIPDLKVAYFGCTICGDSQQVTVDRGRLQEPTLCNTCTCKRSFELIHNQSVFGDKQVARIQETPDKVPAGQTPSSQSVFLFDDLVDGMQPGDRVEITGILRAQPRRVHPRVTKVKTILKTHLDVIHVKLLTRGEAQTGFSNQLVEEMKELSRHDNIYQKLTQSLAPSIWELDNVKKGILCMLFGGNHVRVKPPNQNDESSDSSDDEDDSMTTLNKRGDINILLCGDPGTSKSQLLSHVHKIGTRGVYTSGKGSSAVGLTASVIRDVETRELVLESGALVLSDKGVCCIDEFDKMSDSTRSVLHEAMEQQTVSIAKAGIIATLHARTSILASANPTESRYNPNKSVVNNIQLPPTLLSRFDLIYLVLDSPNVEHDRRLAQFLVGLYYETPQVVQPPLSQEMLRNYIEYARTHVHPCLTDEATNFLLKAYLRMRRMGGGTGTISATPRQLESLIRISEALAKMRFSSQVTRGDAQEAVRLMEVATQAAATDPRTGRIDMDMIHTGRSTADRQATESLAMHLKELLAERRGTRMAVRDVTRQLTEITNATVQQEEVVEALRRMEADGLIQFHERAQTVFVRAGVVG